jgi:hypothetical protein
MKFHAALYNARLLTLGELLIIYDIYIIRTAQVLYHAVHFVLQLTDLSDV